MKKFAVRFKDGTEDWVSAETWDIQGCFVCFLVEDEDFILSTLVAYSSYKIDEIECVSLKDGGNNGNNN